MLARAAAREREMAIRTALGASRAKLIRLVLVESLILAIVGGALGLLLAVWGTDTLVRFAPVSIPLTQEIGIDYRVLCFTLLLSVLTAVLFGLLPALEGSRQLSGEALKEGGRSSTSGLRQRRIFGTLVTAQFALALVLLVAGGLLIRSFVRLMATDLGFHAERVLTMSTSLPAATYATATQIRSFHERLLERVATLPGVKAVGSSAFLPLEVKERRSFSIERQPAASADLPHVIANEWTLGDYFDALGIKIRRGRSFTPLDRQGGERVILVNETMARRFWPGEEPVGQRIKWGGAGSRAPWMKIVGIVADVKQGPLNSETLPQAYQPYLQVGDGAIEDSIMGIFRSLNLVLRSDGDPTTLVSAVRAEIRSLDPSLPVANIQTMEQVIRTSATPQRFNTFVLVAFASMALALAALGIAGVLAVTVSRRTHEIGVRMALGATRRQVLGLVLGQGMLLAGVGLAIGLAASFAVTRVMASLLFGISPLDVWTFVTVSAVLIAVALVASYLPARRATRVDPMIALRYE